VEHRGIRRVSGRSKQRSETDLDDVIYGVHAIEEALTAGEQLRRIHVADERKRDPVLRKIINVAREREIRVRFENRAYFSQFPYKAHQGVIAFGPPFPYVTFDEVLSGRGASALLMVVLDHITDPHNVGAIIRTAEAAGANGIIMPHRRAAGVNATVRKASAGAAVHLPVARVTNVAEVIRKLKKANIWVAGADLGLNSIEYTQADLTRDVALVIGAEGQGLSQLVKRECDYLIRVPMLGKTQSLNASVAAAVILFEALRQRRVAALAR
jgi:23S rRNA (guanosine2251-2'-O)-methyltransferase